MRVFLVFYYNEDYKGLMRVFSTKKEAKVFVKKQEKKAPNYVSFEIEEWLVG